MLITHRGLSGPAILQLSSYWRNPEPIVLDLAPAQDVITPMLAQSSGRDAASVRAALRLALPARFADRWLEANSPRDWSNLSLAQLERRSASLGDYSRRHGRLWESRGHCRRSRHRRAIGQNHGKPQGARSVLYRRGGGCNRTAWRLQFPVGLVVGILRRPGSLSRTCANFANPSESWAIAFSSARGLFRSSVSNSIPIPTPGCEVRTFAAQFTVISAT